jgi:hypothetical protein
MSNHEGSEVAEVIVRIHFSIAPCALMYLTDAIPPAMVPVNGMIIDDGATINSRNAESCAPVGCFLSRLFYAPEFSLRPNWRYVDGRA